MLPDSRRRGGPAVYALLAVPFIALFTPTYLRAEPSIAGIPFFYWYQIALVPISAGLTWIVYLKTREQEG